MKHLNRCEIDFSSAKLSRFKVLCSLLLYMVWITAPGQARVLLKAKGQMAAPLRVKTVEADVQIKRQFATSRVLMTFANEASERIEADFIYTVPAHTVVTYFAYWYQDEKVVARVVEKARAAAIYKHITSRMRDPALIEMVSNNTFRARIFPIEANADLRVEMHFAHVLPSDAQGAFYTFPLAPDEAGTGTLEKLNVKVQVQPDADVQRVVNNFRVPVTRSGNAYSMTLSQLSYRPRADWKIHLIRSPQPMQASLYAARSGGRDGFFALALTSRHAMRNPQLKISGVRVYDVVPAKLPALKPHQVLLVSGRYAGSGTARITVGNTSRNVMFSGNRENNNLATKLWASKRIEVLSRDAKNRQQVMDLSKRYTLPSKFTSWLAVPKEEMVRFRQEMLQAELSVIGRNYALEVANGKARSARARTLKAQFTRTARQIQYGNGSVDEQLQTYIGTTLRELSRELRAQRYAERPNKALQSTLRRQVARLSRAGGKQAVEPIYIVEDDFRVTSREYVEAVLKGGPNSRRARWLRNDLKALEKRSQDYGWNWDYFVEEATRQRTNDAVQAIVRETFSEKPNNRQITLARRELQKLAPLTHENPTQMMAEAKRSYVNTQMSSLTPQWVESKYGVQPDLTRERRLRREIDRMARLGGVSAQEYYNGARQNWVQNKLHMLSNQLVEEKYGEQPDAARIAALQREIENAEKVGNTTVQDVAGYSVSYRLTRLMIGLRQEYVAELRKEKPDRAKLQRLETRLNRAYQDPAYKGNFYGTDEAAPARVKEPLKQPKIKTLRAEIEDIDAQMEAARRDLPRLADLQVRRGEALSKLNYATMYYLRLGDPLLQVEAPADAMQVVAVMPDGTVKKLLYNIDSKRWEARFDIPSYASEGAYVISVIIVDKAGTRHSMQIGYRVDMTAPSGNGKAQLVAPGTSGTRSIRLEIQTGDDTSRIVALLPWGDKVELKPSTQRSHTFFGVVPLPPKVKAPDAVTYVLTDKAHNRTSITIDVAK